MYTGPNIISNELHYGYDSGYGVANNHTATRFYTGEPTVNYVTDTPSSQGGWTGSFSLLDSSRKSFQFNISNFGDLEVLPEDLHLTQVLVGELLVGI